MVKEIEDFREASGLCRRHFLRQGRQRLIADKHVAIADRNLFLYVQVEVAVSSKLRRNCVGMDGRRTWSEACPAQRAPEDRVDAGAQGLAAFVDFIIRPEEQK